MIEIMRKCRLLESLTVNGEVSDASLTHVGELAPRLQRLEVALNSKCITDESMGSMS
jgi:hypothetical protein